MQNLRIPTAKSNVPNKILKLFLPKQWPSLLRQKKNAQPYYVLLVQYLQVKLVLKTQVSWMSCTCNEKISRQKVGSVVMIELVPVWFAWLPQPTNIPRGRSWTQDKHNITDDVCDGKLPKIETSDILPFDPDRKDSFFPRPVRCAHTYRIITFDFAFRTTHTTLHPPPAT